MGRAIKSGQMPGKTGGRMKLNEQSCMGVQGVGGGGIEATITQTNPRDFLF